MSAAAPDPIPAHYPPSVQAALRCVQAKIAAAPDIDASHDLQHILRVVGMTARLAAAEGFDAERAETALLVAALHDVGDTKYAGSEAEGRAALWGALDQLVAGGHVAGERADRCVLVCVCGMGFCCHVRGLDISRSFSHPPTDPHRRIEGIVRLVGFKESLAGGANTNSAGNGHDDEVAACPELAVVNDADQLDAIGAIGASVRISVRVCMRTALSVGRSVVRTPWA